MTKNKPTIICVDDEATVLRSLRAELQEAIGNNYLIEIAEGGEEALELVQDLLEDGDEVPLIISDHIMPDMKGDELLKRVHQLSPKTLKIMLTGQADIEAVGRAIKYAKLYRYIAKPWQPEDLKLTVTEAIYSYLQDKNIATKNAELKQLNLEQAALIDKLDESEQKYRSIFENALEGIFQSNSDGSYLNANRALAQIYGYDSPEELMATITNIPEQLYVEPHNRTEFLTLMQNYGEVSNFESRVYRKDGSIIWISESARTVCDADGLLCYYQGFVEDITARKQAEAERMKFTNELYQLNQAFSRFVPSQFLQLLDKKSIVDVRLGDQVQKEMSVLFSDIRDFTTLSETMTPEDNFKFINAYLSRMESAIIENQGFIDKYIGDGIMALFSGSADEAVNAGIAMLQCLTEYNQKRVKSGYKPISIGIGINTGSLMLGTVGGKNRMDSTVISDDVNLAARLENLTKVYRVSLLITHQTLARLQSPTEYSIRFIERVLVKGKSKAVAVFEVFDGDNSQVKEGKLATKAIFEEGLFLYHQQATKQAGRRFEEVLSLNPQDTVAQIYRLRCQPQPETARCDCVKYTV
ncbi:MULTISPECIES: PAS domain S-box protein [unclassified Coleofasciculus]|uniref:PAS domain S-box protein n=1 Tax=unclassified Coleofasciculus TaxID=2692782 RepID=UPI001882E7CE|nr:MULTISPECIES: adenylate/guanylate cyclase domain-containing protein [unclassified Coleofasciculus]MBE9128247.1 PAS domain S-box protein [Coleofasciculus sp. LEGE 07081]MBE9148569.1 PAS domain S-box protein [Coleofasciculus sp. LEGE 07092]